MTYEPLYSFIEECCEIHGIDESHGLEHSKGCMQWVELLLIAEADVSNEEAKMAIYSAALHDMCDKKYTEPKSASARIHAWLLSQKWSVEMADALIAIVNSMSYSGLKKNMVHGVPLYPYHGKWQRAYHLARHADLLDAYLVKRCFLYTKHVSPEIDDEECWRIVRELFDVRVFRYVTDGWIFLPLATNLAKDLESKAREALKNLTL